MKIIILLCTILCFQFCSAQNLKPQREAFVLKLAVDGVNFYEEEIKSSPYFVHEHILQIYPSEKLYIEVELKNDSIFSMKTVKENTDAVYIYRISSPIRNYETVNNFLLQHKEVKSFEV